MSHASRVDRALCHLIDSELEYTSSLKLCQHLYLTPLRTVADAERGAILSHRELDGIFSNFEIIAKVHERLRASLEPLRTALMDQAQRRSEADGRCTALCMGLHPRLGAESPLRALPPELSRQICASVRRDEEPPRDFVGDCATAFGIFLRAAGAYERYARERPAAARRLRSLTEQGDPAARYFAGTASRPDPGAFGVERNVELLLEMPLLRVPCYSAQWSAVRDMLGSGEGDADDGGRARVTVDALVERLGERAERIRAIGG